MTTREGDGAKPPNPFDRSSKWYQSLPAEECKFSVEEVRIPMADGVHLAADLYLPTGLPADATAHGLILTLGCYGRAPTHAMLNAVIFASRGYKALFVSSRGTFGSEGTFIPNMTEQTDSQSIVNWIREQPCYLGYTQWALLEDPPEDLTASVILCGPHDQAQHYWSNGVFRMDRISWNYFVANQESGLAGAIRLMADSAEQRALFEALPLIDAAERTFDGKAPYMRHFMTTPDIDDPFWSPLRHGTALDRVNVPVLLGSGWYDTFPYQSLEQYERLKSRGCNVDITIGPWTHMEGCGLHSMPEVLDFLDEHVAGRKKNHRPLPVKVFVTGAEEWREMPVWPPATEPRKYYLGANRSLATQSPATDSLTVSFTFDPANPTPTMGGPLMAGGGRVNDTAYASRSDLVIYTTPPLDEEVELMGKPAVQLAHSTDIPCADLFVRLSEVDTNGESHNITEAYQGLDPAREGGSVSLALQDCAHLFKKGTSIRLIVAGGSFPLMARNLGVPGNRTTGQDFKSVTHTIQHGNGVSSLLLPCLL